MTRTRFTSRDLELLPLEDGKRYEIIDGELYVTKQPNNNHQLVCNNIGGALWQWNAVSGLGLAFQAPGVIFAEDNDVAPDLIWVSRARAPLIWGQDGHFHGAPELVIEVLSPGSANQRRDREVKLGLYSRRGVGEYWIVSWERRQLDLYRYEEGELRLAATFTERDTLTSSLLPGFSCPLSSLFMGVGIF